MAFSRVGLVSLTLGCLVCWVVMSLPTTLELKPVARLVQPSRRAFVCDDKELSYPKKPDTVSDEVLILIVALLPLCGIAVVESVAGQYKQPKSRWPATLRRGFVRYAVCILFAFITNSTTLVIKFTVGELRPYFLTVCQVNASFSCVPGTLVEEDVCTGDSDKIRQARLSFPSGHSSLSVYTAVILILYLQHTVTKKSFIIPRVMVQVLLLYTAAFVACSRVMDNAHHLRDVFGGCVLGTVVGVAGFLTMVEATGTKNPEKEEEPKDVVIPL